MDRTAAGRLNDQHATGSSACAGRQLPHPPAASPPPPLHPRRRFTFQRTAHARRPLRTVAPAIFAGLCELYELYLLHVFATFGDVSLWDLPHVAGSGGTQQGGSAADGGAGGGAADPALTPRLRATLLRVAGESIGKYRALFVAQPGSKLARALEPRAAAGGHAGGAALPSVLSAAPSQPSAAAAYFRRTLPGGGPGGSPATGPGMGPAGAPGGGGGATAAAAGGVQHSGPSASELSVSVNPGNLFGLLERCTAAESLLAVGAELARARGGLAHALPQGEGGSVALEGFLGRTLGAAEDLRDFVVRAGESRGEVVGWYGHVGDGGRERESVGVGAGATYAVQLHSWSSFTPSTAASSNICRPSLLSRRRAPAAAAALGAGAAGRHQLDAGGTPHRSGPLGGRSQPAAGPCAPAGGAGGRPQL